jgi:hypothetical protein
VTSERELKLILEDPDGLRARLRWASAPEAGDG